MENKLVTYLIGAGASAHAILVVNGLADGLRDFERSLSTHWQKGNPTHDVQYNLKESAIFMKIYRCE